MPNKCSAPGCRSNYDGEPHTPIFKMPNRPPHIVSQWKRFLHREFIEEIRKIYVCLKHFRDEDVEFFFNIPQPDGSILQEKRNLPRLRPLAVPRFLPGCPSYLSNPTQCAPTTPSTRLDLNTKDRDFLALGMELSMEQKKLDEEKFQILGFDDFKSKLFHISLPKQWILWPSDENQLHLIKPAISDVTGAHYIECSLSINESLCTKGFYNNKEIYLYIKKIKDIRDINNLLEEISSIGIETHRQELPTPTLNQQINEVTKQLRITVDSLSKSEAILDDSKEDNQLLSSLQFILCQLDNLFRPKTHRTYNIGTIVIALKCQLISPACYHYLQSLDSLSLPHYSTLQRLYTKFGLDSEYITFLEKATSDFNQRERNVIVQMDEIHVKSEFTYKGGIIIGSSQNITDPAKTIFAFMVSSLSKKWSTIVRLLPCSNSSAMDIFPIIKHVIEDIERCGLFVKVICTDNYPMNVNIFKMFSPTHTLEPIVPHILDPDRILILLFDFVHILKSIRNNWLNQKDCNCTFSFPSFEDFTEIHSASFEKIRALYKADQSSLAKLAPRLTAKACWPSSLERQNVTLALRVFDNSTASALKVCCFSEPHSDTHFHTAEFITIICDIWKMFNINTPYKGIRLNDELSHPFVLNDPRFNYVSRVIDWLEKWKNLPKKTGKLTTQTFTSFRHSCIAITSIINHLIQDCDFTYVLTSFLQNDPLEHHFGLYRMMSGAQYHISYCQILESERRIKLSSILKLFSNQASTEELSISEFIGSFSTSSEHQHFPNLDLEHFISSLQNYSDITVTTQTLQALAFIAGYTVHSYFKKSNRCQACLSFLTEDSTI